MFNRVVAQVHGELVDRIAAWLRETHGITMYELNHSPLSEQEKIRAEWLRYWRAECEAGRGVKFPPRSQMFSPPRRVSQRR